MRFTTLLFFVSLALGCRSVPDSVGATPAQNRNPFGPWYRSAEAPGWYYDFLVGVESEPDYAGSDDNELEPDANARAFYRDGSGHRYFVSLGEVGAWFDLGGDWTLGTVLEYEEARAADENPALADLDEVRATVEGQLTLAKRVGDFTFAGVLQPDVLGRGKGFVGFLGLAYDRLLFDERMRFGGAFDLSWGDAEHMDAEFGISAMEAARTSFAQYDPGGALKSASIELDAEYYLGERWSVLFGTELEYYFSEASDSPLIDREGSDFTAGAAIGLRYSF